MPSEVPPFQAGNASDGIFNGCFHGFKYCAGRLELWHNATLPVLGIGSLPLSSGLANLSESRLGFLYFWSFHYGIDRRTKSANR
ncbi:TPA: hypothetical protein ACFRG8_000296 [Neisseria lactamica]|uniref:hypothetical protein n=1 Tax=Neisseria lactamica TaxID=486 RepID=UPI0002FF3F77|nr:hypothetical protein [Neisseria lactamica]